MFVESLKIRFLMIVISLVLGLTYMIPNFIPTKEIPWWPAKNKLIYGLDIQGGLHLVLSADIDEIIESRLNRQATELVKKFEEQNIKATAVLNSNPFFILLSLEDPNQRKSALESFKASDFSTSLQVLNSGDNSIKLAFYETKVTEIREQAIQQSIEVIRSRIDEFGVSEPMITAQGKNRILVQLPGIEDSKSAKDLIQRTARLELAIVNQEFVPDKLWPLIESAETRGNYSLESESISYREYIKKLNKDLKDQLPENHRLLFEKAPTALNLKAGRIPYLLDMSKSIQGALLEDAAVAIEQDTNNPMVSFRFQPEGRKLFGKLTAENIGKPLALVLDGVIKSAPNINSKISDRGQISLGTGNYEEMLEEANRVATVLRTGALPADLYQLEEKTVGPSLGQDSIDKGKRAGLVGLVFVMLFMLVYYKSLGLIANLSLVLNIFFLLALMSSLSAVLTLPGVAGIILTIGMAVDANVIIFERIKEELKKGASLKLAVKDGFGQAFSAIVDANITTAIVCFVLIYFSSGPVKGFAVTLFCGILSSLWTAVFVSRTLMDFLIVRFQWKKI